MYNIHKRPTITAVTQNELLSAQSVEARERMARHLALVDLPFDALVNRTDSYVYFPNDVVISLLSVNADGRPVEIGVVGSEGMVGIGGMIGGENPYVEAKVQRAGTAYRVPSRLLRQELDRDLDMRWLILGYLQSMICQLCQVAICYRHHSIEQQFCRKLLMSSDRLGTDELAFTQTTIASMLGVRREGVTSAALKLKELGIIEYHRGKIRILDRARLEDHSCECWAVAPSPCHQFRPSESRANTFERRPSTGLIRPANLSVAAG